MKRLINWLKALFNKTMNTVEDPKLMLKSQLRDLSAKQSKLNDALAGFIAIKKTKQLELKKVTRDYETKAAQVKALAQAGQRDKAEELAGYLVETKQKKESLETEVKETDIKVQDLEKAVELATTNIMQLKKAIEESINESEVASIQNEVASTMESFEADDTMFNIREMQSKLDMQSAKNSARLDVALSNQKANIAEMEADKELEKAQAKALLDELLN